MSFNVPTFAQSRGGMDAWVLRRDVGGEDGEMKLRQICVSSACTTLLLHHPHANHTAPQAWGV